MGHFIPCSETINAKEMCQVLLKEVFKLHGFPREIISDRGPTFVSSFRRSLDSMLGIKDCLTSAYHPESDGQTERLNATLEQYLRCFVTDSPENWLSLLPLAELSYNNACQSSSKYSPFYLNYGYYPRVNILSDFNSSNPEANMVLSNQVVAQTHLKSNLKNAQDSYKKHADTKRKDVVFAIGDEVLLSTKNLKLNIPCKKLSMKYVGPFVVEKIINQVAVQLSLPSEWKVHPVFHVSLLRRYSKRLHQEYPVASPSIIPENDLFEVAGILDSRIKRNKVGYLFDWRGYGPSERTWQYLESFDGILPLLAAFHQENPAKPRDDRL